MKIEKININDITIIIVISIINITDVFNWKDNENVKDKNKENVITIIIENDIKNDIKNKNENKNENINIKNIIRLLRTIIKRLFA